MVTPITGYSLTLVGTSLGSFPGIKSITIGGITIDFDIVYAVDDVNRIATNLPMRSREDPIEITLVYSKTLYNALRTAAQNIVKDTFTLTDVETSTHVGAGWVEHVGGKNLGTDGHTQFTCRLRPETYWDFTPGA